MQALWCGQPLIDWCQRVNRLLSRAASSKGHQSSRYTGFLQLCLEIKIHASLPPHPNILLVRQNNGVSLVQVVQMHSAANLKVDKLPSDSLHHLLIFYLVAPHSNLISFFAESSMAIVLSILNFIKHLFMPSFMAGIKVPIEILLVFIMT